MKATKRKVMKNGHKKQNDLLDLGLSYSHDWDRTPINNSKTC